MHYLLIRFTVPAGVGALDRTVVIATRELPETIGQDEVYASRFMRQRKATLALIKSQYAHGTFLRGLLKGLSKPGRNIERQANISRRS